MEQKMMRFSVLTEKGHAEVRERPLPEIGPHQALVRQLAENQQPNHFLKTEAPLRLTAADNILDVDAPVGEPPLVGNFVPVVNEVAVDIAHMGKPGHDPGAVWVAQAPFHPVGLILLAGDGIIFPVFRTELLHCGALRALVVQSPHGGDLLFGGFARGQGTLEVSASESFACSPAPRAGEHQ